MADFPQISCRAALALALAGGCESRGSTATCPEPVPTGADATAASAPLDGLDARIERVMEQLEVPGLSIAIVKDGEVVHAKGYGLREQGKNEAVDEDTVFAIASNTKAFLATAVGLLVDEGKIAWDDRVADRLPGFSTWDPHTTKELRVRDLLAHRSGLATWAGDTAWIGSKIDTAGMMAALPNVQADYGLRERYGYTNLMFMVAGEVIRAITGKAWDEVVRARILEPLKMTRTTTSVAQLREQDNVAAPHMPNPAGDGAIVIPYLPVDAAGASAALNSSAADMAQWLRLQLGEGELDGQRIIPKTVIEALRAPHTPIPVPPSALRPGQHFVMYGLGWFLYDYHGRKVVTHGGGLPGMTSRVGLVPEEGLGVVVLTNSETSASGFLFMMVMDAYLGLAPTDYVALAEKRKAETEAKKKGEEPPAPKAQPIERSIPTKSYAGTYENALLGRAVVTEAAGELRMTLPDHGGLDCPLEHTDADAFGCTWSNPIFGESQVPFEIRKGKAAKLRFRVRPEFIDPLEYVFVRQRGP